MEITSSDVLFAQILEFCHLWVVTLNPLNVCGSISFLLFFLRSPNHCILITLNNDVQLQRISFLTFRFLRS